MPIVVRDPWRIQYFENTPCPDHVRVPVDDIDCWDWYPDRRTIYDKLNVAQSQGIACGTMNDLPHTFPVFAKPRVNLKGMGRESRVLPDLASFRAAASPDLMWMELFTGPHVSTDCAVVDGNVRWTRHATGETWIAGMFKFWTIHANAMPHLDAMLHPWLQRMLPGYTGMVNIETIGGRIIEAHLRFADQWVDLYGQGWVEALVGLYQHGQWKHAQQQPVDGYSIPLFARHGNVPRHPPQELQDDIRSRDGISSLQITFHNSRDSIKQPMPPGGFRLALVNCTDLQQGFAARGDLAKAFPDCDIIIPE